MKGNQAPKRKKAIVTGVTGQDGPYLAKFLIEKGYEVYGAIRRSSVENEWRIRELGLDKNSNFKLIDLDLTDAGSIFAAILNINPDEIYNLAGQSSVPISFPTPSSTAQINALGPLNILEAIRVINPKIKMYQASTSEMFGKVQEIPQKETTPFYPRSPYGIAKLYAHWMCKNYYESYGIFACCGILFNHESI
jgi:GDPmannose 4,6-dehydratase